MIENKVIRQDPYHMVHYSYCMNVTWNATNATEFSHPYTDMITWNLNFLAQVRNKQELINYYLSKQRQHTILLKN